MGANLGTGLSAWAHNRSDVVVYDLSINGCPLSRGGDRRWADKDVTPVPAACGWWADPSSDRATKLAQFAPDVVVIHDGLNELEDRKLASWPNYRNPGDPFFDSWLGGEYRALFAAVGTKTTKFLFLNAVCGDWQNFSPRIGDWGNAEVDRRVQALDLSAESVATAPNTTVVDYKTHLCPNGRFTQTVDGLANGRPDGYHLSDAAGEALATKWLGPLVMQAGAGQVGG